MILVCKIYFLKKEKKNLYINLNLQIIIDKALKDQTKQEDINKNDQTRLYKTEVSQSIGNNLIFKYKILNLI